ncbi:hypothetical protein L198_07855 [Cryptococcus wingfieldii CBS 7118]|uniref:RING-type domain-containing protein n=1 Tax=Cryptococcus wingfieldii CBS 7118 TaxID=1295528 RepID=A0A1E3HV38_9TREE|nr:hypothetical protein L198_07855 [Cryptococcus wingfieldii CBS 7118]ODN80198.1 hypothetical protein L198_07855 [Cryptococcus wingfieldii CBS 7118]
MLSAFPPPSKILLYGLLLASLALRCAAYIPAVAINDTDGLNLTDSSSIDIAWTDPSGVSFQLQADVLTGGTTSGALVHFAESTMGSNVSTTTPWIAFISCDRNESVASDEWDVFTLARDRGAVSAFHRGGGAGDRGGEGEREREERAGEGEGEGRKKVDDEESVAMRQLDRDDSKVGFVAEQYNPAESKIEHDNPFHPIITDDNSISLSTLPIAASSSTTGFQTPPHDTSTSILDSAAAAAAVGGEGGEGKGEKEEEQHCPICLVEFEDGDDLRAVASISELSAMSKRFQQPLITLRYTNTYHTFFPHLQPHPLPSGL